MRCVCPPFLHIPLGVVKQHHDLLESECLELHVATTKDIARTLTLTLSESVFHKHVQLHREINKLKAECREAVELLEEVNESTPLGVLQPEEDRLKTGICSLMPALQQVRLMQQMILDCIPDLSRATLR